MFLNPTYIFLHIFLAAPAPRMEKYLNLKPYCACMIHISFDICNKKSIVNGWLQRKPQLIRPKP